MHEVLKGENRYAAKLFTTLDPDLLDLVQEDIDTMQKLEPNPRIVTIEDHFTINSCNCGRPIRKTSKYIIMQLIDGISLEKHMKELKRDKLKLSLDDILKMTS